MRGRKAVVLAVAGLAGALIVFLGSTGPQIETEASGPIRRTGGACLQLERWGLFGWRVVGQAYNVGDLRDGRWHQVTESPPCDDAAPQQTYMVRPPLETPNGKYRICGLDDDEACLEFRRVDFSPAGPGP